MRSELDEILVKKYPKIFRNRYADMKTTAMCWGFECGDGWFNIIDALCGNIQSHIDWARSKRARALRLNRKIKKAIELNSVDPIIDLYTGTWWKERCNVLINEKKYEKVPEKVHQVVAVQVKEKFGGLRFYINYGDDVTYGMINMAESMSVRTCEVCGKPGTLNHTGWIKSACEEHTE